VVVSVILSGCGQPAPAEPAAAQASPVADRFRALLEYVPSEWADRHPYEAISPGLLPFDVARVRADPGLPPMTGADERKVKLGLIKVSTLTFLNHYPS
jgi:hypothetical protein